MSDEEIKSLYLLLNNFTSSNKFCSNEKCFKTALSEIQKQSYVDKMPLSKYDIDNHLANKEITPDDLDNLEAWLSNWWMHVYPDSGVEEAINCLRKYNQNLPTPNWKQYYEQIKKFGRPC